MFAIPSKMLSSWTLLLLTSMYLLEVSFMKEVKKDINTEKEIDARRPIWNIAHMVNAIDQVDAAINDGANSVEFDVKFSATGQAQYTFHGMVCDCGRDCTRWEDFVKYIEHLRELTSPGSSKYREELVLLFFDLKLKQLSPAARVTAGQDVAMKLVEHYWQRGNPGNKAFILLSVPSFEYMDFIESFRNTLKKETRNFNSYDKMIGYDFSENEDLDKIYSAYKKVGISQNIWQGDGISNCLKRNSDRLKACLKRRDQIDSPFIDKVYWWTIDSMKSMKDALWMGIDGIITNYPSKLRTVLEADDISKKFRLATLKDNPWEKYTA